MRRKIWQSYSTSKTARPDQPALGRQETYLSVAREVGFLISIPEFEHHPASGANENERRPFWGVFHLLREESVALV